MIQCKHLNTIDRPKYGQDDPPGHYVCLDCGDTFPLIGDTAEWKPKLAYTVADMAEILDNAIEFGYLSTQGKAAISGLMIGRAMRSYGRQG